TELASGINVRDANGNWIPANSSFELTDQGAEANLTGHSVLIRPDITRPDAIQVRRGDTVVKIHPICIGYYDPADGRSVRLADITNAIGWLTASNEITFSNCFDSLRASVVFRNSKSGFGQ